MKNKKLAYVLGCGVFEEVLKNKTKNKNKSLFTGGFTILEDLMNKPPALPGEPFFFYYSGSDTGTEEYMRMFALPAIGKEKFSTSSKFEGETSGDFINTYSLHMDCPLMEGYGLEDATKKIQKYKLKKIVLETGAIEFGWFVIAFGEETIRNLMNEETVKFNLGLGQLGEEEIKLETGKFSEKVSEILKQIRKPQSSLTDVIDTLLYSIPLNENEREFAKRKLSEEYALVKIADASVDKGGYTGRGVIKIGDVAIKIDNADRLRNEYQFYLNVEGLEFGNFCPALVGCSGYAEFDGVGFLPMTNLDSQTCVGFKKANTLYGKLLLKNKNHSFKSHKIPYNLFLLGLFHKSLKDASAIYKDSLDLVPYCDLNGVPHHISAEDPGINYQGERFRRFSSTLIKGTEFKKRIDEYNCLLNELHTQDSLVITDGDWKPDNIHQGYKVDFSCVGFGLEIDDMAYYLSDYSLGLDFNGFTRLAGKYSKYRMMHDSDFSREFMDGSPIFNNLAASAWLRQLVLRHSVMKKRDMMDPEKFKQRQYYQHRINEILREGQFI